MTSILNRIVPANLLDWSFEAIVDQCFTLAAILEFSVSRVTPLCAICQIMRISVWTERYLWTSTIEAAYEVILNKFYLAAILENGGFQNSVIQFPSYTFSYMNFYTSNDIWHTSPSLKLPQDPICSWAKPKTRILATIFSAILSRFTSFHHTNANEVSKEMIFNALWKYSDIVIWKIVI